MADKDIPDRCFLYKKKDLSRNWDARYPYVAGCEDIRGSFETEEKALLFLKEDIPHLFINPITFMVQDERWAKEDKEEG